MMSDEVIAMNEHVHTKPISIDIEGMTCASCVARVEKSLMKVPSVNSASVNLATQRATVQLGDASNLDPLLKAIEKAGYKGSKTPEAHHHDHGSHQHHDEDAAVLRRDVLIAAAFTLPLFVLEMGGHLYMPILIKRQPGTNSTMLVAIK